MWPFHRHPSSGSSRVAALLVVLVVALVAGPASTTATGGATTNASTVQPTPVDSCVTITVPGRYELVRDLTDVRADACIRIESSDVVLDGDGHAVDGATTTTGVGVLVAARGTGSLRNVTVRNLRVTDWLTGVAVRRVTGADVRSVTATGNGAGVDLVATEGPRVAGVRAGGNDRDGIRLSAASNATVSNATVAGNGGRGVAVERSADVTLFAVAVSGNGDVGVDLLSVEDVGLTEVEVVENRLAGVLARGSTRVSLLDSTVGGNAAGVRFARDSTDAVLVSNRVEENDGAGVELGDRTANVSVRQNAILDNGAGVRLGARVRVGTVAIGGNVLTGNDRFGVLNEAPAVVDARGNDWGATDGPSSAPADDPDRPFVDPATGRPADGSGDGVSEHPEDPGVSNVRFDPFAGARATALFPAPLEARLGDTVFLVGPPRDLDGDGRFEDVTGDGALDEQDVAALQVLVRALAAGGLELSDAQVAALDFDGDGALGDGDVVALAEAVG